MMEGRYPVQASPQLPERIKVKALEAFNSGFDMTTKLEQWGVRVIQFV